MKLKTILRQIQIILLTFLLACNQITPDNKTTLRGDEVIGRLQYEIKKINNFYFTTNFKNSLPYKSSHYYTNILPENIIAINRNKNYQKEGVDACIENIRTIGFPIGGDSALLTCDIKEVGFLELGGVGTGGKSVKKNELLLNILALP